jgi:hypothetical protein
MLLLCSSHFSALSNDVLDFSVGLYLNAES